MDVLVDPIDGTESVVRGYPGAISVVSVAPRDSMWSPTPAIYMEKIVVDREAAGFLVPECMDAPAAWTLALIARAKNKAVRDLQVIVLRSDGDTAGALIATTPGTNADILMGVGGVSEGVAAACAVKAIRGGMLGRLAPQSEEERSAIEAAGLDVKRVLTCDELVSGNQIFFSATGVTDGPILGGVEYHGRAAKTHSLIIRSETGVRRVIHTEYTLGEE
ncbi:MAG: fructose-bisphosphatase class II [Chloroflexi bacterium]|nr:fructose-bisphosphatase class II [Chloroflexota bacterium]